jgi:hypothetical protein
MAKIADGDITRYAITAGAIRCENLRVKSWLYAPRTVCLPVLAARRFAKMAF